MVRSKLFATVVALALAAVACGGGSSVSGSSASSECTRSTATDLTGEDPFTVTLVDYAFEPACFAARSSASIIIENTGAAPHTFTLQDTKVDVLVDPGKTFRGTSAGLAPGTYILVCKLHPQMVGTVFVT